MKECKVCGSLELDVRLGGGNAVVQCLECNHVSKRRMGPQATGSPCYSAVDRKFMGLGGI